MSVMASYNEIDGIPSHANRWLLRDVLRKEWGFQGFIVSDYYAITELKSRKDVGGHGVAPDLKEACRLAVEAGVNIELPEPECYLHLVELVRKGILKEKQLDELVAPMLHAKFQLGLFDDPYVDPGAADALVGCDEHRQLALQAARQTITLLKNENHLAPFSLDQIKTIAVIGPNANRSMLGGYSGIPKHDVSVLGGNSGARGRSRQGALQRRVQDHGGRLLGAGRGGGVRSRGRPPADCRGREGGEEGRPDRAGHRRQ
jgi:beta-glucosidase